MELRSSRVLKRGKPKTRLQLSSDKSVSGKKRATKAKIGVFVDNCDEKVEIGMKEVVSTDDKGLFLGSEALDPIKDSIFSCPKIEIEEESVERVEIEEGNGSVSLNLSETGRTGFNKELKTPNLDSENGSENLGSEAFVGDIIIVSGGDDKETLVNDTENVNVVNKNTRTKGIGRCLRSKKNVSGGEITVMPLEHKRGMKRKNVEREYNGDERAKKEKVENGGGVHVSGMVLRSRSLTLTTTSGGDVAVSGGLSGITAENRGRKKNLKKRGRHPKVKNETDDGNSRPKKKLKRARGRPVKVKGEITISPLVKVERRGRPRKVQGEMTVLPLVKKDGILIEKPRKGRPRKVQIQGKETVSKGKIQKKRLKNMIFKKLKRRTRSPKMEAKKLATHVIKMRTVKRKEVKKLPKIQKIQKVQENKKDEENSEKAVIGDHLERQKIKQLIRDKISDMLLKSGWKIDLRQRQFKSYKDAVYIEPNEKRSHWSITGAYKMLKKKIEENDADNNEISAYSPIPEEEISMLFRHVDKELGYKKKKNKKVKTLNKGKIVKAVTRKKKKKNGPKKVTKSRKPRLLARGSENGSKKDNNGVFVIKKRNLLSWMIDSGGILVNSKVKYGKTRRKKKLFEGIVTNDGISCNCCNEIMGMSDFASHCGGKISNIFDDLYLESGMCFRDCLLDSWKKEELNIIKYNIIDVKDDDPNDDTCNICGDGGNLICCDGCPSTFHQSCLEIQNFPSGDWKCIYCSCKFCGIISINTPQVEDSHDAITSEMLTCRLCEEKFHQSCLQEVEDVNADFDKLLFCGKKCEEVFERVQTYLGVKHELEDGFSWTLLQRTDINQDLTVHERQLKVENNSKLAVAFSVMDECFVPIIDERSGINIIHNVVYNCGSNFRRLNYSGFLTAVLEKGDELITTASIRIHGYRLAEMPFIGTRHMYRRQGMCRRLLDAIESALYCFGVEELVIPAIPQLLETWTKVFGFTPLEKSKKQEIKSTSMIVFPGIDMLKKPLIQNHNLSQGFDEVRVKNVSSEKSQKSEEFTDAISVGKDIINDEQQEEPTVVKDITHFENDNIICDLNLPLPCDTDGQTSVDSECNSVISGNHQSPELKLDVENDDGIDEVKVKVNASSLASESVMKNMFDLNLHPAVVETDLHIIVDQNVAGQSESQPLVLL